MDPLSSSFLSFLHFLFSFVLPFLFSIPLWENELSRSRDALSEADGGWDLPEEEEEEEKKVGNYLRSASYAVKLETERTKAKYVSSTMSVWGYCDILTSREKCHFTPCWLGCGVSI